MTTSIVNNYFKVLRSIACKTLDGIHDRTETVLLEVYPFDGNDLASTKEAYRQALDEASLYQGKVVAYRRPSVSGPWRDVRIVGENYVPSESERGAA